MSQSFPPAVITPTVRDPEVRPLERQARDEHAEAAARRRERQEAIAEAKRLQREAQIHTAEAIGAFQAFCDAVRRVRAASGF